MNLALRGLYPNFQAEATRHPSSSPGPTNSKGTGRRNQDLDPSLSPSEHRLPRTTTTTKQQRLITPVASNNQSLTSRDHVVSSRSMPLLSVSPRGSQPLTSEAVDGTPCLSTSLGEFARDRGFVGSQPTILKQKSNSESPEDTTPIRDARHVGTTRSLVLRGDLARDTTTISAERIPSRNHLPLTRSSSMTTLSTTLPLQEMVQCSVRPRSRYARREIATPIQPLPHHLSQSASSPALSTVNGNNITIESQPSTSSMSRSLRGSQSTNTIHTPSDHKRTAFPKAPILSWTEQDTSSFFLTEVDAKDVADQWTLAKAVACGAHMLYALHAYDQAVACFADAVTLIQDSSLTPVMALLHHHMGIAFHDDGHAKWALMMQKKALELAQQCDDLKLQARALKALGVLFLDRAEPHRALDCQQQALQMAVDTGDAELEARVYANLGNLASTQQEYHHAIMCHERDLSVCHRLDSAVGQARAHRNLALLYAKMDNHTDVQRAHERAAARLETVNVFETDMQRHADDVVGNIYWQLTAPDATLATMVATSIQDLVLTSRDDEKNVQPARGTPESCIT